MLKRDEVAAKLHRYDQMRRELLNLERELNRDCTAYGKAVLGITGYTKDHLRIALAQEKAA